MKVPTSDVDAERIIASQPQAVRVEPAPAERSGEITSRDRILTAPLVGLLWSLSWPLALTGQVAMITEVIIVFWIGNLLGTQALATLALLYPMFTMLATVFAIPGVGANILATQSLGAADGRALTLTLTSTALTCAMWFFLLFSVLPFMGPIVSLIAGASGFEGPVASYLVIWIVLVLPMLQICDIAIDFANSTGWTRLSLVRVVVDVAILLLLAPVLIDGLGLGLVGAPVAEAMAALALVIMIVPTLWRRRGSLGLGRLPRWRQTIALREWGRILALGTPTQASRVVMSALQMGWAWLIATEGDATLAGYGVTINMIIILMLCTLAIATSNAIVVGQAIGAGSLGRARASTRTACTMALGLMSVLVILSFHFETALVSFVSDDVQAIAAAERAFSIMRFACFGNALWQVLSAAISAAGAPARASIPTVLIEGIAFGVAILWPTDSAMTVMAVTYVLSSIIKPLAMLSVLRALLRPS